MHDLCLDSTWQDHVVWCGCDVLYVMCGVQDCVWRDTCCMWYGVWCLVCGVLSDMLDVGWVWLRSVQRVHRYCCVCVRVCVERVM